MTKPTCCLYTSRTFGCAWLEHSILIRTRFKASYISCATQISPKHMRWSFCLARRGGIYFSCFNWRNPTIAFKAIGVLFFSLTSITQLYFDSFSLHRVHFANTSRFSQLQSRVCIFIAFRWLQSSICWFSLREFDTPQIQHSFELCGCHPHNIRRLFVVSPLIETPEK